MKTKLITLFTALAMVACSSSDEALTPEQEYGEGSVALAFDARSSVNIISSSAAQRSEPATVEIPKQYIPDQDDFSLVITGTYYDPKDEENKEYYKEFASLSDYNTAGFDPANPTVACPPFLVAGSYKAVMEYGDGIDVESATNAHFKGEVSFEVVARKNDGAATITVSLQNSMIKLQTSEYYKKYFAGGSKLNLSTTQNTTIAVDTTKPETEEQILFVTPGTTLYLEGEGVKQDPGNGNAPTVKFEKQAIGKTAVQTLTTVVVDADDAGGEKVTVSLNDTFTEINTIDVDLH